MSGSRRVNPRENGVSFLMSSVTGTLYLGSYFDNCSMGKALGVLFIDQKAAPGP